MMLDFFESTLTRYIYAHTISNSRDIRIRDERVYHIQFMIIFGRTLISQTFSWNSQIYTVSIQSENGSPEIRFWC